MNKLSTGEIFNLPHHLQTTALAMVLLQEGTVNEITQESDNTLDVTQKNLATLYEMGFIGVKQKNGNTINFCLI